MQQSPWARVLVPYDGSEPAGAALRLGIALAQRGAALSIVTVVDETPVLTQSADTMSGFDPEPILEALEGDARAFQERARAECAAAGVEPQLLTLRERPVAGILKTAEANRSELIVIGTHARTGLAHMFIGSTAEGVLRSSRVPVVTVRTGDRLGAAPFGVVVLAVDDSEPADAAAALAQRLAAAGSQVVAVHAVDVTRMIGTAASFSYGLNPEELDKELRQEAADSVATTLERAHLPATTPVVIADDDAAPAIVAAADERNGDAIVIGTHGRRGLRRFMLGSVAESVVRTSDRPVLVVPATPRPSSNARSSSAGPPA